MYAIVEIAGKQLKVTKEQRLYAPKLPGVAGDELTFDRVLFVEHADGMVVIGAPTLASVRVQANILEHTKGDKVIVFKKKRRNGYKVKRGHRQDHTMIVIKDIVI